MTLWWVLAHVANVFGQRPKTAGETLGETPALPNPIASFRLRPQFHGLGSTRASRVAVGALAP
jgi:hypothetical protein